MEINNRIDTNNKDNRYFDSRDIKAIKEGARIRLYGSIFMGHSYFQKQNDTVKVVRSIEFPEMVNPSEGYQGAEQKPATNLYSIGWNYETETPMLMNLDKVALIKQILAVNDNDDLADVSDYDFRVSFDNTKAPAEKYQVIRLDKSDLTKEQKKALVEFEKTCDISAYSNNEEAFPQKGMSEEEKAANDEF